MALTLRDCHRGTIVDHTHEVDDDGERPRTTVRRGIITRVVGDNSITGSIKEIWVTFKKGAKEELVKGAELSRVYAHDTKIAHEAWRRVMGLPKQVGLERKVVAPMRVVREDGLGLTPPRQKGVVAPSEEREAELDSMGFTEGDEGEKPGE